MSGNTSFQCQICHLLVEEQKHQTFKCGAFVGMKECRAGCCFPINGIDGAVLVLAVVGLTERPYGRQNEGFRFQLLRKMLCKTGFAASVCADYGVLVNESACEAAVAFYAAVAQERPPAPHGFRALHVHFGNGGLFCVGRGLI